MDLPGPLSSRHARALNPNQRRGALNPNQIMAIDGCSSGLGIDDIWGVVCEELRPSQHDGEAAPPLPGPLASLASLAEVTSSTPSDKVKSLVRDALGSASVIIIDELTAGPNPQFVVGQVSEQVVSIIASAILVNVGGAPVDEMTRIEAAPDDLKPHPIPGVLRVAFLIADVGGASAGPWRRHLGMFKLHKPVMKDEKMEEKMMASLFIQAW